MAGKHGDAKKLGDSVDPYRYRMDYDSMGTCVIINNKNFSGLSKREGTDIDADAAATTFHGLGYKIIRVNDQTTKDMEALLKDVSGWNHRDSASFVCVLLSHGKEGVIYGKNGGTTKIKKLTGYFRSDCCKDLLAKPKLFFIQACSGDELDHGCQEEESDSALDDSLVRIPLEADFFYAYSTAPGYFAYRSPLNGTRFMQVLCERLKKHKLELELMRIMTRVNHQVARDFGNKPFEKKQIPCIMSMLTKDFVFPR